MLNNFEMPANINQGPKPVPVAKCTKCKSEWFEQVKINQFMADHYVVPGQGVPVAGPQEFVLLRCIKCLAVHQPNVLVQPQDTVTKLYNDMIDNLETT